MDLYEELKSLLTALDREEVDYALIGGLAVAIWGAPRFTQDIDLLVPRDAIERAKQAARSCGFLLESLPMSFRDGTEVHRVSKTSGGEHLMVDLTVADRHLEYAWRSRRRISFDGGSAAVVSRECLIAMKVAAGRQQDLLDVEKLRELDR